jgi:hypothetical protein
MPALRISTDGAIPNRSTLHRYVEQGSRPDEGEEPVRIGDPRRSKFHLQERHQ